MVRGDDTLQLPSQETALLGSQDLPWEVTGNLFEVTEQFIFESELLIEVGRRCSRQRALRRTYGYFASRVIPRIPNAASVAAGRRWFRQTLGVALRYEVTYRRLVAYASAVDERWHRSLGVPMLCVHRSPRATSLASSHGEITEGDDLAARRANLHALHKAAMSSSRGVDLGGGGGRGIRAWEKARVVDEAVGEIEPKVYVVIKPGVDFAYAGSFLTVDVGEAYYKRHGAYRTQADIAYSRRMHMSVDGIRPLTDQVITFIDSDGQLYSSGDFVLAGTVYSNYVNDVGYYKFSSKHVGRMAVFPFVYASDYGWVFKPALNHAVTTYSACVATESLLRTVTADLVKRYPTLPVSFVQSVVAAYKAISARLNVVPSGGVVSLPDTLAPEWCFNKGAIYGACVHFGMWSLEYKISPLRPSMDVHERRDVLDVIREDGGTLIDGQLEWVTPCTKVMKKVVVAVFFGGQTRFEYASACSANQAAALVRLYKPRGGSLTLDRDFSRYQLSFILSRYPVDSQEFIKFGRMQLKYGFASFGNATGYQETMYTGKKPYRRLEHVVHEHHASIARWHDIIMSEYLNMVSVVTVVSWLYRMLFGRILDDTLGGVYHRVRDFSAVFCSYGKRLGIVSVCSVAMLGFFLFDVITFRYFVGHLPHVKASLRKAVARARYGELQPVKHVGFVNRITAEVKDEGMKPGRPPRLYFSLGLLSPLFGGGWIEAAKKNLYRMVVVTCSGWELHLQFLAENSPEYVGPVFQTAAQIMTSGYQQLYAVFMSDDVAVFTPDGVYDLDISMCDASLGSGVLWLVWLFLRACWVPEIIIQGLFQQISKDVEIRNPSNKRESIVWRFISYYLVSGTVLTTLTDSIASLMVISAFCAAYTEGVRDPDEFARWFEAIGLCVTVEHRSHLGQAMLLKRHPMQLEDGTWCAPLAFGALLKRFGLMDTDLSKVPGETLTEKAEAFLGGVVESWKGEPGHPLLDAFRLKFPSKGYSVEMDSRLSPRVSTLRLSVDSFCHTYGVDRSVYEEAVSLVHEMKIGSLVVCELMDVVNRTDYGL